MIQMGCGACGEKAFSIHKTGDRGEVGNLVVKCNGCMSTTVVRASKPVLEIAWGKKSKGVLAPFGGES